MGLWERGWVRLGSPKPDYWLHNHRSFVTSVFLFFILFQFVALILSLTRVPWYPHQWVPLSIVSQVELLLATGTLVLAFAALTQAVSAEKKRRDDLTPHLDIQILRPDGESQIANLFPIDFPAWQVASLRVRNLGPGNAIGVRVRGHVWWRGGPGNPYDSQEDPNRAIGSIPYAEDLSLRANEDHTFPLSLMDVKKLQDGKTAIYQVFAAASFAAWGTDVDGIGASAHPKALRVLQGLPDPKPFPVDGPFPVFTVSANYPDEATIQRMAKFDY